MKAVARSPGFTAIEVLVSIAILALAFVPVLTMLGSGNKESAYSELHMIAQTRAESILELVAARDWSAFATLPPGTPTVLPEALTSSPVELPQEYRARLASFEESVTLTPLSATLAEVGVEIDWVLPGDDAREGHHFRLRRLIARSDPLAGPAYSPRQVPEK